MTVGVVWTASWGSRSRAQLESVARSEDGGAGCRAAALTASAAPCTCAEQARCAPPRQSTRPARMDATQAWSGRGGNRARSVGLHTRQQINPVFVMTAC
eukprot:3675864-Pleurochrysis_carterae.AAC.1